MCDAAKSHLRRQRSLRHDYASVRGSLTLDAARPSASPTVTEARLCVVSYSVALADTRNGHSISLLSQQSYRTVS